MDQPNSSFNEQTWLNLNSSDVDEQIAGWLAVERASLDGRTDVTLADVTLVIRAWEKTNPGTQVGRAALRALMTLMLCRGAAPHLDSCRADLGDWFWRPFRETSTVFRALDPDRRRDEDAVIELARSLPQKEFPNTEFVRVRLDDPRWDQQLHHPKTVCIVGRLGVFGGSALEQFDTVETQFYFPTQPKPLNLKPGSIDPKRYHRIQQRTNGNIQEPSFVTKEKAGRRTDYALVQRYYQRDKRRYVFILAGCSTLGTLGAVKWVARLSDFGIPLPPTGLTKTDTFEALIRVSAKISDYPQHWDPDTPELVRLVTGQGEEDQEWFPELQTWGRRMPTVFLLRRNGEGKPLDVYVDEVKKAPIFRDSSAPVHFIDAVFQATGGQTGTFKVAPSRAWADVAKERRVRKRLIDSLPGVFEIDAKADEVTLRVPIRLVK